MTTTAPYIKTSMTDQDGQAQVHSPRRAAEAREWVDMKEVIDLGHSGAKAHRPPLDQLRAAARRGEIRQVLVFALDRLSRSLRDLLLLLDDLTASGCAVVSLCESIALSTPTGWLLVHLIASLAEFEQERTHDRVRAGLARVKATGRPRAGRSVGRPRREVDLQAVTRPRAEGRDWREIAQAPHVPRRTLLRTDSALPGHNAGLDPAACSPGEKWAGQKE